MFSMHVTPTAKAAILEQFALMGLREPGLFVYRRRAVADVVRSEDGHAQWDIQRHTDYIVQFVELPGETIGSAGLLVVDGLRVALGPMDVQPPHTTAMVSVQKGDLYMEDVASGSQVSDLHTHGHGIRLGLVPMGVGEVISSSGGHRLCLLFIAMGSGYDFHSIRYEAKNGGDWAPEVTLTQKQFQGEHEFGRWVTDLHTVQDDSGVALIKVGEHSRRIGEFTSSSVSYSWRTWDLRRNVELRRLKECRYPNEPLE